MFEAVWENVILCNLNIIIVIFQSIGSIYYKKNHFNQTNQPVHQFFTISNTT